MIINRVWSMPNKWTFTIKPIKEILERYSVGKNWADPFAGEHSPAEITNDLNPVRPTDYHIEAIDFCKLFDSGRFSGVLFDPPYNLSQLKECYGGVGKAFTSKEARFYFSDIKREISRITKYGGIVISCGWNSGGIGRKYGFKLVEILLVPHGGVHNDTIITVERKNVLGDTIVNPSEPQEHLKRKS